MLKQNLTSKCIYSTNLQLEYICRKYEKELFINELLVTDQQLFMSCLLIKYCVSDCAKKEPKKKIHEEVIAEDYDSTKDDINQIDISQKFMVNILPQLLL